MGKKMLITVWSTLGITLAYLSINFVLITQNSPILLPSPLVINPDINSYTTSVYGIVITIPILIIIMSITKVYINSFGGATWESMLPIAFNMEIDLSLKSGKYFQQFFFTIILVIPLISQVHFINKFFHGTIYNKTTKTAISVRLNHLKIPENTSAFKLFTEIFTDGDKYRYGAPKKGGMTFFPFWESWILVLLEVFIFYKMLKIYYILFFKRNSVS